MKLFKTVPFGDGVVVITLTLQTHKQVRKYRIFNCTDLQ